MAFLDDLTKAASSPAGLVTGVGAALLTPMLVPAVSRVLYPGARALLSAGITLYRSAAEPISAVVDELMTEAQMELATSNAARVSAATAPEPAPSPVHRTRRHKPSANEGGAGQG